jgi:hypothetical protein
MWTEEQRTAERERLDNTLNFVSKRNASPTGLYNAITGTFGIDRSAVSADMECRHGRLPGDRCPQPAMVPGLTQTATKAAMVPNPNRLWDKSYPCGCWPTEARVAVPDPFNGITRATRSHRSRTDPVRAARVVV